MATEFQSLRIAFALTSLLTVSACSSKNPDTLVGMNLDENAAMMDANAAVEANIESTNVAETNPASPSGTSNGSDRADKVAAEKPTARPAKTRSEPSDQVNATDIDIVNSAAPTIDPNPPENDADTPNAT